MKLNRFLPIILGLVFLFGVSQAGAQVKDDPILKVLEETENRLKAAEIKLAGAEAENKLLKEVIVLKDEKIVVIQERADFFKKQYDNSTKIDTNSQLIIDNLRLQVNDYKIENADLRHDNDKLRSSRNTRTWLALGIGGGLGYYFGNKK